MSERNASSQLALHYYFCYHFLRKIVCVGGVETKIQLSNWNTYVLSLKEKEFLFLKSDVIANV